MAAANGPIRSISEPGIKIDGYLLHNMRQEVAQLLDRRSVGFPGAQPVSFARRHIEELTRQDYYVCEKSDGMRYLLYLTQDEINGEAQYLIDRKNDYWFIPKNGLHFPVPRHVEGFHVNTLIDGELVVDKLKGGGEQTKYLVFDCLILDGNSLMNRTLDKRLAYFQERIYDPYKSLLKEFPEEIKYMHFIMEMKQMQFSYTIDFMFGKILPELPHGNDGLIFTCRMSEYKFGTDQKILKWKPEHENSIDFQLSLDIPLRQPDEEDISDGYDKPYLDYDAMPAFNLYVHGGEQEDKLYGTLYLEPTEWGDLKSRGEPLDDRIVECYMDVQGRWRYMRFRDDKTHANHISTVESVIESIKDGVTKQDLINAQQMIRSEWKAREWKAREKKEAEKKDAEKRKVASQGLSAGPPPNAKRKAEEQGEGRPSPGPPVKKEP